MTSTRSCDVPPVDGYVFLDELGAGAFVHVGRDADLRYLAGLDATAAAAFVYVDGEAALHLSRDDARSGTVEAFPGTVRVGAGPAGRGAVGLLDGRDVETVATPSYLPHDAALYLEEAGYALRSTTAVADARAVKSGTELERIGRVGDAASAAMRRVEATLASATVADGELLVDGEPLSPDRLRRTAGVALAERGAAAANVAVDVPGPGLRPGVPCLVSLVPRGPEGYHARLARTFVVAGEGGWERRAHVACEAARGVAARTLEAGVEPAKIREETVAELAAYGFGDSGGPVVAGVGLARREGSAPRGDPLEPGSVVAVAPTVRDGDAAVGLGDTFVVTDEGCDPLATAPTPVSPSD